MYRSISYVLVFLVTLLIGSFMGFGYFHTVSNEANDKSNILSEPSNLLHLTNLAGSQEPERDEYEKCGISSDIVDYEPIIEKWMREEELKPVLYCSKNMKEADEISGANIKPTLIDLNRDGTKELFLESQCSPTGNCDMEILERTGDSYRKIFTSVYGVQVFGLKKSSKNGYFNIWAKMHGSSDSGGMVVYRFDGQIYRPSKCFDYHYEKLKSNSREYKNLPTLTRTKCPT